MKFTFSPESRPLDGYTIKRAIHRGGFGEVYYALSDGGREVALKLLQHNTDVELRGVQQCLNLSHPNLVTIFDIRQDADGDHWIIMEYASGETLDQAIRRYPQGMPMEQIRNWITGIGGGIKFLHSRGLVHRDLKPANVFLEDKTVKIGDVGLSKFITASRRSAQTQSVGTVYYMAPEVAKGRYGKEVDIYALGIMLYELLTGHVPFTGESTGEILMKHLTESPDLGKLPPRMRGVVSRALEKEPERRFGSIDQFLEAFQNALVGKGESLETPGPRNAAVPLPHLQETLAGPDQVSPPWQQRWRQHSREWTKLSWWGLVGIVLLTGYLMTHLGMAMGWFEILAFLGIGVMWLLFRIWRRDARVSQASLRPTLSAQPATSRTPPPDSYFASYSATALAAVPVSLILTALLVAIKPTIFVSLGAASPALEVIGLFLTVTLAGVWGMLALATRLLQHTRPDQTPRIAMAGLGGVLGLVAWGVHQYLMIELPTVGLHRSRAMFSQIGDQPLILTDSGPTLLGYVAFFAFLFLARDWSAMLRPNRDARFSIGRVAWTVAVAWFATQVFVFPIPLALAWGAVLACVVQLSSPWRLRTPHGAKLN